MDIKTHITHKNEETKGSIARREGKEEIKK